MIEASLKATSRPVRARLLIALGLVAAAYFVQDVPLTALYHLLRTALGIPHAPTPTTLLCSAYALLVTLRLLWWIAVTALVAFIAPPGITSVLILDKEQAAYLLKGLAIGLAVMAATILTIVAVGAAQLYPSPGSAVLHAAYGAAWLVAETLGAAGEELLFRGLILILAARLFGMRPAILISALAFALAHGANPGASPIWMIRLAAAGLLLGYSVVRSGSLWWATGYHAGWNLASAPLFGAAGSGYIDQGHLFTFLPTGPSWITGGPVGPEGSLFAFAAVGFAAVALLWTVPDREQPSRT